MNGVTKYLQLYVRYCLDGRWRDAHKLARIAGSDYFDAQYYLDTNPDVRAAGVDPIVHYVEFGAREWRNPSELFDTANYLRDNPEALADGTNPLLHYLVHGRRISPAPLLRVVRNQRNAIANRIRQPRPTSWYTQDSQCRNPPSSRYVIYTAIVGGYDDLKMPAFRPPNCDFVAFSDHPLTVEGWKILPLNYLHRDPTRSARFVKLHPHLYFPEYTHSIWMDANLGICGDIGAFFDCLNDDISVAAFPHPLRDCIYAEGEECIIRRKDNEETIRRHLARYKAAGIPQDIGLWETNFLVRRHNDPSCIALMSQWWKEIEGGSRRDQLSLPFVQRQLAMPLGPLDAKGVCARHHPLLTFRGHRRNRARVDTSVMWPKQHPIKAASSTTPVTIGVCVHNSLDKVKLCLASLVRARNRADSIVIVDDASDVATAEYLHNFAATNAAVRLVRNDVNLGYTRSANLVLKAADTDWVVLLNSDTVVPRKALRKLIAAGERHPRLAVVGPLSNAAGWQSVPKLTGPDQTFIVNELPTGITPDLLDELCEKAALGFIPFVPLVNGFCFAIRRSVLKDIGFLDEINFPLGYGEEDDLCVRATDAGYVCGITTDAYVFHYKSASFTSERRILLSAAGREALDRKYGAERISSLSSFMLNHKSLRSVRRNLARLQRRESIELADPIARPPLKGRSDGIHPLQ